MEKFFANIGIEKEELLKTVNNHRENDPNKEQILQNIENFKNRKFK